MSRLREKLGEPVEHDSGSDGWHDAMVALGECFDVLEGEKLLVYGDSAVYAVKTTDGHYWTVVGNADVYDLDLAKVEDFLFENWVRFEYPAGSPS